MKSPLYSTFFRCLLVIFLFGFSFLNNGNATTEQRTTTIHFEKKNLVKRHFNKKKKHKKHKRLKRQLKKYDDFDYNILLLIAFGMIGLTLIFLFLGLLLSLIFWGISFLLLLICIFNGAHKSAWWALGFVAIIFWPIALMVALRNAD